MWVLPPPLPVMVTLDEPAGVEALVVIVRVELPDPGAAIVVGVNVAVAPLGSPDADKLSAELNPPLTLVETVEAPEPPCVTLRLAGLSPMAKSGLLAAVTVRGKEAV